VLYLAFVVFRPMGRDQIPACYRIENRHSQPSGATVPELAINVDDHVIFGDD
jgi:hypothetical protein